MFSIHRQSDEIAKRAFFNLHHTLHADASVAIPVGIVVELKSTAARLVAALKLLRASAIWNWFCILIKYYQDQLIAVPEGVSGIKRA
jgi:hypothetical protein